MLHRNDLGFKCGLGLILHIRRQVWCFKSDFDGLLEKKLVCCRWCVVKDGDVVSRKKRKSEGSSKLLSQLNPDF